MDWLVDWLIDWLADRLMNRPSKEWSGRPTPPLRAPPSSEHLRTTLHSTHRQRQPLPNRRHRPPARSHTRPASWQRSRGKTRPTARQLPRAERRRTLLPLPVNWVLLSSSVERFSKNCLARDMRSVVTYLFQVCSLFRVLEHCCLDVAVAFMAVKTYIVSQKSSPA